MYNNFILAFLSYSLIRIFFVLTKLYELPWKLGQLKCCQNCLSPSVYCCIPVTLSSWNEFWEETGVRGDAQQDYWLWKNHTPPVCFLWNKGDVSRLFNVDKYEQVWVLLLNWYFVSLIYLHTFGKYSCYSHGGLFLLLKKLAWLTYLGMEIHQELPETIKRVGIL